MDLELFARIRAGIRKAVNSFQLKYSDHLAIVSDDGVDENVLAALRAISVELSRDEYDGILLMSERPTGSAQPFDEDIEKELARSTAWFFLTSLSRSHCPQTVKYVIEQQHARLMSVTNGRPDIWLEGAINEDFWEMRARVAKLQELCCDVSYYHVTDANGTDLIIAPWQELIFPEPGLVTKPGQLCNFPFGECAWPVRHPGTAGVIVSNGVVGTGIGYPDEPIRLTIEEGIVTKVEGGESARKLETAMDEADRKAGHSGARYIAEVAFGANAAAWRDNGNRLPPTSLEGEKAYSATSTSMHIAHGANHLFGVPHDAPEFSDVAHHTDHVLWGELNVYACRNNNARFDLITNGVPMY